jgi:hypothetical protein
MRKKTIIRLKILKNKKIMLALGLLLILIIILSIVLINNRKSDDGLTYNKNKSFVKEQNVKGISFKNIKCTYNGKDSIISYTMINKTKKDIYLNNYDIIVKDKDNNKLTKIVAGVTQTIKPNEEVAMSNQIVGVDLTDAYYMELIVNTKKNKDN